VNHPDAAAGANASSIVAVVASTDGMLGQYAAYIAACDPNKEPVDSIHIAMERMLATFCQRNGNRMPEHIIVYRDGISEGQFGAVLDTELQALRSAIDLRGYGEDSVKITFIVCQKRHTTRFFYQPEVGKDCMNPCVGLCVDAQGSSFTKNADEGSSDALGCIVGSKYNEFYLNSHLAVLGTSKPTKYVVLHDEIGLTMSEMEVLTFWTTHLYGRCTRSVSLATPAYYAHWAARRGKVLMAAGMSAEELSVTVAGWIAQEAMPSMFFL